MSEKSLVVQHNNLVEARYKLSVEAQRLIKTLVSLINQNDENFKIYELRVIDLARMIGLREDSYYKEIKKVTKSIIGNVIQFTNQEGDEIQAAWLSSAVYKKNTGIVELSFDPVLKPYLLQLKSLFTPYELGNILHLKGIYSIRIYELLKQYERIGKREFDINELRLILKIDSKYYGEYKNFKRKIIKPAIDEISEKTDLFCDIQEMKVGRSVSSVVFLIKKKSVQTPEIESEEPSNELLVSLIDIGVSRLVAEQLVTEYDKEQVGRGLAIMREKQKAGSVKDPAAFVVTAIKKDFVDSKALKKDKEEKKEREQFEIEKMKKSLTAIKDKYAKWKLETTKELIYEMSLDDLEKERELFWQTVSGVIRSVLSKNKEAEERHFLRYMEGKLNLDSLEVWAQKNNIDLSVFPEEIRNI